MQVNAKIVSSLEKCFLDSKLSEFTELTRESVFKNQRYSFQLLFEVPHDNHTYFKPVIEGALAEYISVREVISIPSDMPVYTHSDDDVLRRTPGLYPDLLRPLKYNGVCHPIADTLWAFWFTLELNGGITGEFDINIKLMSLSHTSDGLIPGGEIAAQKSIKIDIKNIELPEQKLKFSQWFYADCLADYYHVPVFSDEHFRIIESFIKTAVAGGRNMILTPLLTYSLDIYRGGYRTTCQLVDVYKNGGEYTFGYENLDKWLDICNRNGVKYYEICHFFSQWGAMSAPKVMAYVDGEYKRIFGWETNPLGEEYKIFLRAFVSGFLEHMKARGEDKKCWFHISDEPNDKHLLQYKAAKAIISDILKDYHIMDALSQYEFYEQGIVETPVPSTSMIRPFIEHNVPDLWCYYCGSGAIGVSNCHFSMSLARTRYIGIQMFKYNIEGFLNWGYNFYNNRWSFDRVDPFLTSSGEGFSVSGDTYMVYPAPDGSAWESLRFVAFYEGIEDMRALSFCASLYSFEETVNAVEEITGEIVFDKCICDPDTLLKIRRKINEMIFAKI